MSEERRRKRSSGPTRKKSEFSVFVSRPPDANRPRRAPSSKGRKDRHRKKVQKDERKEATSAAQKSAIMTEYTDIVENIIQQNANLENLKEEIMNTLDPKKRRCLQAIYNLEEEKLNEEIVKAMVLQSKCPYEKWPPIPITTNINEDVFGCNGQDLLDKARRQASEEMKNSAICRTRHR